MHVIGFHNPEEEYGFLSNWYPSAFCWNDIQFASVEQYMMYRKALYFDDQEIVALILKTEDVARIKELGRMVSGYDDRLWGGIRQLIVYEGLKEKFSQNPRLREQLLETGDAILAECAVKDRIWGIGLSKTDPNRFDLNLWKGQNLLGYALMMARYEQKRLLTGK